MGDTTTSTILSQSEWNERLRQRVVAINHALEIGQDIDRKLLVLVLVNAEALLDMYEHHSATIAKVHAAIGVAHNAPLCAEHESAHEQKAKSSHDCPTTPQQKLALEWQQVPSQSSFMYSAKLGEYIAEVWQLEDGTFRAWVRELSCVLRSDSGLASLGVAQTIAEKWLKDILAKKMDELRALQSVLDNMGLFAVGDVIKTSNGSLGIVIAKRGDLIRIVFDDGVRLGIIPNTSLDDAEPIIQHVTPRRRVVVPPELDSHDVELRRMLARNIIANKGTTT